MLMKSFLYSVLCVMICSTQVTAQTQDSIQPVAAQNVPSAVPQTVKDYSGGYGHFFTGMGWVDPSDLVSHLQSSAVFGPSFSWENTAVNTGFEGYAEIHRLLVGGGGFGNLTQDMEADSGVVRFAYGGGYAKVGYVLFQQPRFFTALMAGFGGGVMYVGIENTSSQTPIYFSSNQPVFPEQQGDYFRGYLIYDFTLSNKLIATSINQKSRKFGGLMFGLDLGASIGIPVDTWRDDYGPVTGIPSPGTVVNPYLRLTVGGGGFRKHYAY